MCALVTGVQTCALPISELRLFSGGDRRGVLADFGQVAVGALDEDGGGADLGGIIHGTDLLDLEVANDVALLRDGHARFPLLSGMASKSSLEVAAIQSTSDGACTRDDRKRTRLNSSQ